MGGAGAGEELLLDFAAVGEQAAFIAGGADGLGEHDGGGGGLVELGDGEEEGVAEFLLALLLVEGGGGVEAAAELEGGAGEAAGIEDDPDLLAALDGILADDGLEAACGGGPGDVADFVAADVISQAFELAADAAELEAALLQLDLAGAHEVEASGVAALLHGGKDADGLGGLGDGPALDELEAGAVTEEDVAEFDLAAAAGEAVEGGTDGVAGEGLDAAGGGGGHERGVEGVGDVDFEEAVALLEEFELDYGGLAEAGGIEKAAGEEELCG